MRIISYEEKYRDDMIFMILEAKDALGRVPGLNPDLLDIQSNYLDKGDGFWLALSDRDRVIGSVGYSATQGTDAVWLHRMYVKASMKRQGIGTALYQQAEKAIKARGFRRIRVHLGGPGYEGSRSFYQKLGFVYESDENYMAKRL